MLEEPLDPSSALALFRAAILHWIPQIQYKPQCRSMWYWFFNFFLSENAYWNWLCYFWRKFGFKYTNLYYSPYFVEFCLCRLMVIAVAKMFYWALSRILLAWWSYQRYANKYSITINIITWNNYQKQSCNL